MAVGYHGLQPRPQKVFRAKVAFGNYQKDAIVQNCWGGYRQTLLARGWIYEDTGDELVTEDRMLDAKGQLLRRGTGFTRKVTP